MDSVFAVRADMKRMRGRSVEPFHMVYRSVENHASPLHPKPHKRQRENNCVGVG